MGKSTSILMVCLGNICRSPMAEGIMKKLLKEKDLLNYSVDSAGIGGWHEGDLPDHRAIKTAKNHSIDISIQRARQIRKDDFERFVHILVMDHENLKDALGLAPKKFHHKIKPIMEFKYPDQGRIVPDPYYSNRFEESYQLIYEGCVAFVDQLIKSLPVS